MISQALSQKGKNAKTKEVEELFSRPIKEIESEKKELKEPSKKVRNDRMEEEFVKKQSDNVMDVEEEEDTNDEEELSAFQIKERNERTIFVGNIELDLKSRDLIKFFKKVGKIEKVRFRSVPIQESKIPVKASVILRKYVVDAVSKNAYVIFSSKEEAEKALSLNGSAIRENHIRVDFANKKELDYTKTIFIGNLAFNCTEEELRKEFQSCGDLENIRVIRDPITHMGKGIGYITFKNEAGYQNALKKNNKMFKERPMRIKKAVRAERLEKKKKKKERLSQRVTEQTGKGAGNDEDNEEGEGEEENRIADSDYIRKHIGATDIGRLDVNELRHKREISMSPRIIRKKIKRAKETESEKSSLSVALNLKRNHRKKMRKEVLNDVDEMEKRRKRRKIKIELNRKKQKSEKKAPK